MRLLLRIVGALCVAMGLLWAAQGMGWVRWPASSFMIDVREWTWRGLLLAFGGVLLILGGRPRRR